MVFVLSFNALSWWTPKLITMFIVFLSILFAYVQPYVWDFLKAVSRRGKGRFPLVLPKDGKGWEHALREGREKVRSLFFRHLVAGSNMHSIPIRLSSCQQ